MNVASKKTWPAGTLCWSLRVGPSIVRAGEALSHRGAIWPFKSRHRIVILLRMSAPRFALFPSPIGKCAIVWGDGGVRGLALPERDGASILRRLCTQFDASEVATPTEGVTQVIERVQALLTGQADDLLNIELDYATVPPFHQRVYVAARRVGFGTTVTYGELAKRLLAPGAARAVGQALGKNPFAIIVPCHRIVAANGKLGGFTAHGGASTKQRLLEIEGSETLRTGSLRFSTEW